MPALGTFDEYVTLRLRMLLELEEYTPQALSVDMGRDANWLPRKLGLRTQRRKLSLADVDAVLSHLGYQWPALLNV